MYTGIFVDDEEVVYAELMSTPEKLVFKAMGVEPLTNHVVNIRRENPMVVALDFRLDEKLSSSITAEHSYKGSGLAQLLRDRAVVDPASDFAIVLVSNESKLKKTYAPDKTAHDLFDLVFAKEEIRSEVDLVRKELLALAQGYEALRTMSGKYEAKTILGVAGDDDVVFESQELEIGFEKADAPHLAVRHLLRNIIERNGLLLDGPNVSAKLGIDPVDLDAVAPTLGERDIAYGGLLSTGWARWWGHRLEVFCDEIFGARATSLPSDRRAELLSEALGIRVRPNPSPWNGKTTEYPSLACASCHRPVEFAHSVAAFDPRAPKYSDPKRICWDCIQTDRYQELNSPLAIDESDADLIPEIRKKDRN